MTRSNYGLNIRIGTVIALCASLVFAPGTFAATSISQSTSNLTTVPQAAVPTLNAMTGNAQDPYTPTTTTPDYFGTPDPVSGYANGNFANSPLPVSVLIQGAGTGAFYTAEYETNNLSASYGQVTKFDVVTEGSGYDWQAGQTTVSVIGGGGYGATGTPVIDHVTGAITSITLNKGGKGYGTSKGIRKFVKELPKLPSATAATLPGVNLPGSAGYTSTKPSIKASDFYEIAAIRSKWQFSPDLGYTTVNMYVQIDPNHVNTCPTGETALTYPNGTAIKNIAGDQVCAFNSNTDATTKAVAPFSYLGPVIVAQQNRPVRVTFDNYLPTGTGQCTNQSGTLISSKTCGGDLFLPVDSTIMGAGSGPNGGYYSTNRASIHLHGGVTPWISDGTMDQWVTPVNANEQYPAGVSTRYVPDMWYDASGNVISSCYGSTTCGVTGAQNNPGKGRMTFYYTNQDTARLMFYHDHSAGITRLNVYSGLAAGYLLHDDNEGKVMVAAGVRSSSAPNTVNSEQEQTLIIQDKTFVPSTSQLTLQDPTWNTKAWGGAGSLWFPHVYQPNQNPALTPANSTSPGATPTGRWDYGPWMWPAVTTTMNTPVKNPLCNPTCTGTGNWVQNTTNPGVPTVSAVPEAFSDVMTVNGVAYPYVKVAPKVYRFQLLNASNDRTLNLAFYYAKSTKKYMTASGSYSNLNGQDYPNHSNNYANKNCSIDATTGLINMWGSSTATTPACADSGEVSMLPWTGADSAATQGLTYPDQGQDHAAGVQDMTLAGPDIVQIGTEGGLLPGAAVQPSTPIGFEYSRQTIVTTNVKEHSLILGPAQRADILVDFSNIPSGSTLILYNDAPAPFPGFDPRFDYYTGDADQTASGGSTTTLPGYAPNTRTIMQIQVVGTKGASLDINAVNAALLSTYSATRQSPVVPQQAYDAALGTTTVNSYPGLNDSSTTMQATGVASIAVDSTKVGTHTISATKQPQVVITGGNGNGARAVPVITKTTAVASVTNSSGLTGYSSNNLPNVTVTAPTNSPNRTATVLPYIVGGDQVKTISVTNSGAGYTSAPNVTIVGGSTTAAQARAVMKPTALSQIKVNNGGVYTGTPTVSVNGGGTNEVVHAYAELNPVGISGVNILSSTLYSTPPTLSVVTNQLDLAGVAAKLNAYLSTSIQSITVTNAGACTSSSTNPEISYFDVNITNGGVSPTAPSLVTKAHYTAGTPNTVTLRSIDVVDGGANYQVSPTITIVPVGMTCTNTPTAVVQLTPGPIASVVVDPTAIGSYTMTPTIVGPNLGDAFQVILEPSPISAVNIINQINSFTAQPTVGFSTGQAVATAVLNSTSIDYIEVLDSGSGYIVAPQVSIDAPTTDPTCMTASNCATATVDPVTGVLGFNIVDAGDGYTSAPTVTITGGGQADGTATANLGNGQVSSIIVTNPGTGYLSSPKVSIFYPAENVSDDLSATAKLATQKIQITYQPKGIGEEFELMYGRMNSIMASEVPLSNYSTQTTLLWTSIDPPTEVVDSNAYDFGTSKNLSGTIVDTLPDGSQLWRYTHNGVDTHFIHFHMFNVQVIARIGWDGVNQPLDNYDLGWRDTVQFDPLTIMYIAIKPIVPDVPWQLPNSIRPLSPSDPIDQVAPMMMGVDSVGNPITNEKNVLTNFGWEYMIHCHLLGHEENDMMRPMAVGVALVAPTAISATKQANGTVVIQWQDNSINETGFKVQRFDLVTGQWIDVATKSQTSNTNASNWNQLTQTLKQDYSITTGGLLTATDNTQDNGHALSGNYQYRVISIDQIGTKNMGEFPVITSKSDPSNVVYVTIP